MHRFLVSELALRQPVGGPTVMARQVRRMIEEAERPNVSIRVVPSSVAAHPGMLGGFVVVEFADEPAVVHIEGRMSGMFPENPAEIADYRLATERLTELTADERQSVRLLHAIAEDLEK